MTAKNKVEQACIEFFETYQKCDFDSTQPPILKLWLLGQELSADKAESDDLESHTELLGVEEAVESELAIDRMLEAKQSPMQKLRTENFKLRAEMATMVAAYNELRATITVRNADENN